MNKIAVIIQGPIQTNLNGYSTVDVLKSLQASVVRANLFIVCALWEDEPAKAVQEIADLVDKVVLCRKPASPGAGNRNYQREGVNQGLHAIKELGFKFVLKTRTDFLLSEKLLQRVCRLAGEGFQKILVTNLFTRFESFHVSDMLLFSTFGNIEHWFRKGDVHYEDLYSPEVEFARVFIRSKRLRYTMRFESYLRFLRDWIELVDFRNEGLLWLKDPKVNRRGANRGLGVIHDRDSGIVFSRLVSTGFHRFLRRTRVPLPVIALWFAVADPVWSFTVIQASAFLKNIVRVKTSYRTIKLPTGHVLHLKIGFKAERYNLYTVDRLSAEYAKPVGEATAEELSEARASKLPFEEPNHNYMPGVFAVTVSKPHDEIKVVQR